MRTAHIVQPTTAAPRFTATQSILHVPGIGRRTGKLLYHSGIRTVQQFLSIPEFLLEETFGPSLVAVRNNAQTLLQPVLVERPIQRMGFLRMLSA